MSSRSWITLGLCTLLATPSFADASLAIGSKVGRYFGVVSMTPALFFTLWAAALLNSNAWRTAPDLKLLATRMGNWSLTVIAWLLVATLLVALFLHPLQFAMTQLLEGTGEARNSRRAPPKRESSTTASSCESSPLAPRNSKDIGQR